ncbi:single-stranded DNA-binding protein [Vreelandella andesensis]|uniref:Single-stranded DNA-binding protein n=1 Tax=Vreelandella andesensis TaxID=447567 RepID=A0A3S0XPP9_9GAMM|nr:ERF family protein [Halomonas andesensis]RUR26806.1 single-stranded DNA-binding protein [Halomonas andesensis]
MSNAVATTQEAALSVEAPRNEATAIIQVIERAAMNPDVDIDKMERLLQMQERVMDRQASADYSAAMAAMQSEIPSITRRGKSHNGNYASLEDIVDEVRPILQRHGFAVSFRVKTLDRAVEVTGVLMHRGGHREETAMILPADTSGSKNAVQAFGSSTSYGKRYVICSLLNITTRGEDDDGESSAPTKLVTSFQSAQIAKALAACPETTQEWFASNYGDASKVPKAKFDSTIAQLSKIVAQQETANAGH